MQEIIPAVDKVLLEKELNKDTFIRRTNYGNNEIYIVTHHDSPNVMREIGRLREVTFRAAGGGTGKDLDVDKYDIAKNPYQQMLVWDPEEKEIIGAYRFICCKDADKNEDGEYLLATRGLFEFSNEFIQNYLPYTIELGRSWVQPNYQPAKDSRKGLFALDNIWDGLGAIVKDNPGMKYLFGKVTMYQKYNREARNTLLYFMYRFFPDPNNLVYPVTPLEINMDKQKLDKIFTGNNYQENYKILVKTVRSYGENIPPLINIYMGISPSMRTFGTVINPYFGDVEETGIMVTIGDIYDSKKNRHINTYKK